MQFGATGQERYHEGSVVEFMHGNSSWVGNFAGGATGFDTVFEHPSWRSVIVIARGQGYIVDPRAQKVTLVFGGAITALVHSCSDRLVFSTFTEFEAYGAAGQVWRTSRLSWDGFRSIRVDGDALTGEGWTPPVILGLSFASNLPQGKLRVAPARRRSRKRAGLSQPQKPVNHRQREHGAIYAIEKSPVPRQNPSAVLHPRAALHRGFA